MAEVEGQRTICRSQFSSTMWGSGLKLELLYLTAAIFPAHGKHVLLECRDRCASCSDEDALKVLDTLRVNVLLTNRLSELPSKISYKHITLL